MAGMRLQDEPDLFSGGEFQRPLRAGRYVNREDNAAIDAGHYQRAAVLY